MSNKFKTRCIVPNCNSGNSAKFNRFPKDTKQCQRWVRAVKNPFLETLSLQEIQTYRVCHLHFTKDSFFVTAERPRLKWDAVPFLRLPSSSDENSEELKIDLQSDEVDKNKKFILRAKPKIIDDYSLSYEEENNLPPVEDMAYVENNLLWEDCLFKEINPVENILNCASKEFRRAEKGKEITIAFKIRANLYKYMNPKSLEYRKLKSIKKENRKIILKTYCIVPNCKSGRNITKHAFPKDEFVGEKWVKAIKSPYIKGMSYEEIRKRRLFVCYLHFPDDSWSENSNVKPRLKPYVVPTLYLPEKWIKKKKLKPRKPIDLPKNEEEVPNVTIDFYFTTIPVLSYNSMPKICDFMMKNESIRESSFKVKNYEDFIDIQYRSINDVGGLSFETKYSKETAV